MDNEVLQKFAVKLKGLREETGLSQEKFAYLCTIDRTYMGKLERAGQNPSLLVLSRIAKGLDMKLKDLLDFE